MANSKNIRVRLKAYDHKVLDLTVAKIIEAVKKTGASGCRTHPSSNREKSLHYLKISFH